MTSKLTKEWLQHQISAIQAVGITDSNTLAAFKLALAAMDSEPLAVTDGELNTALQLHRLTVDGHSQLSDAFRAGFRYARRTTPQPAPVVSADLLHTAASAIEDLLEHTDPNTSYYSGVWADVPGKLRAAMLQAKSLTGNSPVIGIDLASGPDRTVEVSYVAPPGYVMVPMRLTAENGAKGALSGEFSETKFVNCSECFGDDECETCDGSGRIEITVPVSWTTIKEIWAKGVEHFAAALQEVK